MPQLKAQFARNAISGWVSQFVFVAVGFMIMPYAIWRLGQESYGIYQIARSALVFFMFLQIGMAPTLVRFCAKSISLKDMEEMHKITSTAQVILGIMGLLGVLVALLLIPAFLNFYSIPVELQRETSGLLVFVILSLLLNMLTIVPLGVVLGANRYDMANGIESVTNILKLVLLIAFFEILGPSILLLGVVILMTQLFRFVAIFYLGWTSVGRYIFLAIRQIRLKTMRSLLGFSGMTFVNTIAVTAMAQAPILMIGKMLGTIEVTRFAPAIMISNALLGFVSQVAKPLTPLASRDMAENQGANLGKWSINVAQITACIGLGMVLPFCIFGKELLDLWLGAGLADTWIIVVLMAIGAVIAQTQSTNLNLALGATTILPFVASQVVLALIVLAGLYCVVEWLGFGLLGIALFIGILRIMRNAGYLSYVGSKLFSYHYGDYLMAVYVKPLLLLMVSVALGWTFKMVADNTHIIMVTIGILVSLSLYALGSWFFVFSQEIRQTMLSFSEKFQASIPFCSQSKKGAD